MSKLCAVLIPSRKRFSRLLDTLRSVVASAGSDDFEIIVRLDLDDAATVSEIPKLLEFPNIRVVMGHRHEGYASIDPIFNTEMARLADTKWIWLLNDDAIVEGKDWVKKLSPVADIGFTVQPETIRLGGSTYTRQDWTNFPCVPNQCWTKFGKEKIHVAADSWFYKLLNQEQGWTTHFLEGITVSHQRDSDDSLEEHRKI